MTRNLTQHGLLLVLLASTLNTVPTSGLMLDRKGSSKSRGIFVHDENWIPAKQRAEDLFRAEQKNAVKSSKWPAEVPDATVDGPEAVKAWAKERLRKAEADFAASGRKRFASPDSWGDARVYHVQADRFNNGNVSNDYANIHPDQQAQQGENDGAEMPNWRHGGDIRGIRNRLGYIADLQANVLWVTPLLHHDGFYAGYCATNPTQIDPGFGTNEDLKAMVEEAHALGLRVVMDVVVNHLCDRDSFYSKNPTSLSACTNPMNESFWDGTDINPDWQGKIEFSDNFFPPLKNQDFFNRCGVNNDEEMRAEGTQTIYGDFDVGMYDFNSRNTDFQEIFTDFMKYWIAYADIDAMRLDAAKHVTEDYLAYFSTEVRDYANSLGKDNFFTIGEIAANPKWVTLKVGRMRSNPEDPEKAVDIPVALQRRLMDIHDIYMAHTKFPFPGLNAMYHFEQSGKARKTMLALVGDGRKDHTIVAEDIVSYLRSEPYHTVMNQLSLEGEDDLSAAKTLWSNLELHDWPRMLEFAPHGVSLARAALLWVFGAVGVPVIYAGQEQGLNGQCPTSIPQWSQTDVFALSRYCPNLDPNFEPFGEFSDPHKRQDMFMGGPWQLGSAIPSIEKHMHVGPPIPQIMEANSQVSWENDQMLPRHHDIYRTARALGKLRQTCPILIDGRMKLRQLNNLPGGVFSFSRLLFGHVPKTGAHGVEAVVVVQMLGNGQDDSDKLEKVEINKVINPEAGQRYVNVFDTSEVALTSIEGEQAYLVFDSPRNIKHRDGGGIFMHEDLLLPFDDDFGVALCRDDSTPGHEKTLLENFKFWQR